MKKVSNTLTLVSAALVMLSGCKKDPVIPTLNTTPVSSITSTTAVSGGNITDDGGAKVTARGICWSLSENPTTSDNKTSDGNGSGSFPSNLAQLAPATTYFVRAYAVNSAGTAYGDQVSFKTTSASSVVPTPPTDEPPVITGPQHGTWARKTDFPGEARFGAAGFSIGTKAYLGLGYNQNDYQLKDFWEYDQSTNTWTRKANYPGNAAGETVAFSIGTKGYIGTGSNNTTGLNSNEFWEYDPASDAWSRKAPLPTTDARAMSVGFSIGTKGYIALGYYPKSGSVTYYNDLWEWDQETDVWTKKADFPGSLKAGASGFSIGNKGYIGTGSDGTKYSREFWEWDQAANIWTRKADFIGIPAFGSFGFSIGNKGYIADFGGKNIWEWDQPANSWSAITNSPGTFRALAAGFSIGNKGYMSTGGNGGSSYNDLWELIP